MYLEKTQNYCLLKITLIPQITQNKTQADVQKIS